MNFELFIVNILVCCFAYSLGFSISQTKSDAELLSEIIVLENRINTFQKFVDDFREEVLKEEGKKITLPVHKLDS